MLNQDKINEIVDGIVSEFKPEKVILFGSYAINNVTENSDLDLLIIKKTTLQKQYRGIEIRKSLQKSLIPIDILVYTPDEFILEKDIEFSFINQTLKNAKMVYERE